MGRTACTEPQCLYSRAIPLLPLWAVRPLQNLTACTRGHFTFTFTKVQHYKTYEGKITLKENLFSRAHAFKHSTCFNILDSLPTNCTLTEVFPCFFLSCKANARVKPAKTGHGPHSSTLVVICVVLLLFVLFCCYLCCSMYCLCVNMCCHRETTQLLLIQSFMCNST
jgi:hypothetical protein